MYFSSSQFLNKVKYIDKKRSIKNVHLIRVNMLMY